ncbi:type II toxin-antitoxin system RelE/ParE family toxin [Oleomonas cavernae]|uniref:Type II toxin-antitoxin system RelE/ParE family toxin n=1 Tax=Oleomonas cavernae TaxID=2320859 RepID=A0A418W9S5_9PROT|nr:type II toxin-antitoxin system RelE/ParE family toxin [Oleomonas cavernae]RJF86773.1 type II toxin-antitoxin system RelE/ParE family toxin [Oleomonas cavernae]
MRRLVYRSAALGDLDGIYDLIEPDNPRRALSFVQDIRQRCRTLCTHPHLGPARNDLSAGIRTYPMFGRVVVAYRVTEEAIVITRVFYGGQDYETLLRHEDSTAP